MRIREDAIPVRPEVQAACELLGLDPLYVANEGKLIAICPPEDAATLLAAMRAHPLGAQAALIGEVVATRTNSSRCRPAWAAVASSIGWRGSSCRGFAEALSAPLLISSLGAIATLSSDRPIRRLGQPGDQSRNLFHRHWLAEQKALDLATGVGVEESQLLAGLDAFGGDLQ